MITKQEYIESLAFEFHVLRHLGAKVTEDIFEFRPTPKQRSTHELMKYLCSIFGAAIDAIKAGSPTVSGDWEAGLPEVTLENFGELLQKQEDHARKVVGEMTEEELSERVTLYGTTATRAAHLLNGPIKWAAAYKLQLFMHLKMTGQEHLNTLNLWAGMDPMPKEK